MALAQILGSSPTREDLVVGGQVQCSALVARSQGGTSTLATDQYGTPLTVLQSVSGTAERTRFDVDWLPWSAARSYIQGSVVTSGGSTWQFVAAGPSVPGVLPAGPDWVVLTGGAGTAVRVSPLSATVAAGAVGYTLGSLAGGASAMSAGYEVIGVREVGQVTAGTLNCEGLRVSAALLEPSIGSGTLVAGTATIATVASDPTCRIFLQRTGAAPGTPVGVLQVTAKTAVDFTVESVDPATGLLLPADVGTFDWWIVSPNYA